MERTTRIIYVNGNSVAGEYAPRNCKPYGTKWRLQLQKKKYTGWGIVGSPKLLMDNWDIDEEKVRDTDRFFEGLNNGCLY